jgi:hypothetical protein
LPDGLVRHTHQRNKSPTPAPPGLRGGTSPPAAWLFPHLPFPDSYVRPSTGWAPCGHPAPGDAGGELVWACAGSESLKRPSPHQPATSATRRGALHSRYGTCFTQRIPHLCHIPMSCQHPPHQHDAGCSWDPGAWQCQRWANVEFRTTPTWLRTSTAAHHRRHQTWNSSFQGWHQQHPHQRRVGPGVPLGPCAACWWSAHVKVLLEAFKTQHLHMSWSPAPRSMGPPHFRCGYPSPTTAATASM